MRIKMIGIYNITYIRKCEPLSQTLRDMKVRAVHSGSTLGERLDAL